jgi:hypothetical protein
MATARLQVTDLDFDTIKNNLKDFLRQQSEFTDYDFEGAGLNVLLDILAYNTHYNAYYLNMVANESFLDTATTRDAVVSHAKTLNYVPRSVTSPKATINVSVETATTVDGSATIPRGFVFYSELVDNKSYNYVTIEDVTVSKTGTTYEFENIDIYEGQYSIFTQRYIAASNPKSVFTIPNPNVDIKTLKVSVVPVAGNTATQAYSLVSDILDVTGSSTVYFINEGLNGRYNVSFGDGVLGAALLDGSTVSMTYLVTSGAVSNKANSFNSSGTIGGFSTIAISVVSSSAGGSDRESVDSIKFSTASQFATQNRLITFKDYETYILQNYTSLDSISVWGGEDEEKPVYGKVFISLKPKTNYYISEAEKQRIIDEIIKPKAVVSTDVIIRDPEFLYLLIDSTVRYDARKTTLTEGALKTNIRNAIINYSNTYLNKFSSKFILSKLQKTIDGTNLNAFFGTQSALRVQKRLLPSLISIKPYSVKFNIPLRRGTIGNRLTSTFFKTFDALGAEQEVQFEEIPQSFSGISNIQVLDAGVDFTSPPTVTISGDGIGAEAVAIVVNGKIARIEMVNRGIDYTRAIVTISDGGGYGATAIPVIDSRTGTLRTVYYNQLSERQIVNSNAGTIDYNLGTLSIGDIRINSVSSPDGYIRFTIQAENTVVSTNRNTIITIDGDDPTSISTVMISEQ